MDGETEMIELSVFILGGICFIAGIALGLCFETVCDNCERIEE